MSEAQAGWSGSVALVLASSTGGVGKHVASLAHGLIAAGCGCIGSRSTKPRR